MSEPVRIGDATLYCGRCEEIELPRCGINALVSDPPYGVSERTRRGSNGRGKLLRSRDWQPVEGDDRPFDPSPWLRFPKVVLWGANNFAPWLPPSRGWIVWDKRPYCPSDDNGDCELAWTTRDKVIRVHRQLWRGCMRAGEENMSNGGSLQHPTQKPIGLMMFCLDYLGLRPGETVLDPYMGSGTTGIACARMGLPFVGVECDSGHFATACRRIEEAYRQGDMFIQRPPAPIQEALL